MKKKHEHTKGKVNYQKQELMNGQPGKGCESVIMDETDDSLRFGQRFAKKLRILLKEFLWG